MNRQTKFALNLIKKFMKLHIKFSEVQQFFAEQHKINKEDVVITDLPNLDNDYAFRVKAALTLSNLHITHPRFMGEQKIESIKFLCMEIQGLGLGEAKTIVESNGYFPYIRKMLETGKFF